VVSVPVVGDGRMAVVVDPQLAYDDVVDERVNFAP